MGDKQAVRTEAIFTGFSSKVDGSLSFRGTTPELSTPEKIAVMNLQGLLCEMLVFPRDEKDAEIVEVRQEMMHKSPSQRMRAVMFLLWKEANSDAPFETFYAQRMESLIEWLKSKLKNEAGYR
jgi:hypothetical protein